MISLVAQAHAEGDPARAEAVWEAGRGARCARVRRLTTRPPRPVAGRRVRGPAAAPRRAIEFAAPVPDPTPQAAASPSTPPTGNIPGAFEGETVTRRRFMIAHRARRRRRRRARRSCCPALGFAAGSAVFERPPVHWKPVGAAGRLPGRQLPAARDHRRRRASARSARPPSTCARTTRAIDGPTRDPATASRSSRSPRRCMHLGCPVRWTSGRRALHLPVPRRRLRLPGKRHRRSAGAPARPLLHPHAQRPGRDRPALLGQLGVQALPAATATRASRSTASASTSTPAASRPRS